MRRYWGLRGSRIITAALVLIVGPAYTCFGKKQSTKAPAEIAWSFAVRTADQHIAEPLFRIQPRRCRECFDFTVLCADISCHRYGQYKRSSGKA